MTHTPTELDGHLIASLQRLTEHLTAQNERIEHLTEQLNELAPLAQQVAHLQAQVRSLTTHLRG